jgi:hypothetical protein
MVELGKVLKEALIYSRLTYCNSNLIVGYILKEEGSLGVMAYRVQLLL